ncbi:MAG: NADH-quinone oxidoreductase subunit M [Saprospiraceae bacterium]|nr:NADH-quinone oxidoreductase subunit M [Saprospiraceae bacterium]
MLSIIYLILVPLIFGLLIILFKNKWSSGIALAGSAINLFLFFFMLSQYNGGLRIENQFSIPWIPELNVDLHFGLDALGIFMILLSSLILPVGILASIKYSKFRRKSYYVLMMIGLTSLIGFFSAQNDLTFYVFFELALIPFYFMVLMYGGSDRKRALFKFFLYTVFGSFLMLASIIYFRSLINIGATSDWSILYGVELNLKSQTWIMLGLLIAFAIKSPLFPFHTWQADLYSEGDRPAIIIIAAVLSKMGVFGILRFFNIFENAILQYQTPLIVLSIIGIIYAALIAWRQSSMTRLLAYSSLSHMGMIAAGIFSASVSGLQGSLFQMLSHGLVIAGLFMVVDSIMSRTNNSSIYGSSGIATSQPRLATYFFILCLGSVGLPLTSGFIGEFDILLGLSSINWILALVAGTSIILSAIYIFRFYQKSMFGDNHPENKSWTAITLNEEYVLIILSILVIILGFFPASWLELADQATSTFVQLKSKIQ